MRLGERPIPLLPPLSHHLRIARSAAVASSVSTNLPAVYEMRGGSMRSLLLGVILALVALPAVAVKRVTVAQLEQTLATNLAAHREDIEIARRLGELELTERLTGAELNQLTGKLALGSRTALAVQLLADQSSFLDPPAGELPTQPPPDAATEQRIFAATRAYIARTLPLLPDFIATRTAFRFDNSPQVLRVNEWPIRAGLHIVGTSTREITVRDDYEEPAAESVKASAGGGETGLHSFGEFGPFLKLILMDVGKGKLSFHHWEKTTGGLIAVYRYSVPKSASHYLVDYCCLSDGPRAPTLPRTGYGHRGSGSGTPEPDEKTEHFRKTPAYHGSLFIDPESGAVLRFTAEADLDIDGPITRAAVLVQYGPVVLGERKYLCPLLSVALTQGPAGTNVPVGVPPDLEINETTFTQYHRLGSSIRMLPASDAAATQPRAVDSSSNK